MAKNKLLAETNFVIKNTSSVSQFAIHLVVLFSDKWIAKDQKKTTCFVATAGIQFRATYNKTDSKDLVDVRLRLMIITPRSYLLSCFDHKAAKLSLSLQVKLPLAICRTHMAEAPHFPFLNFKRNGKY